MEDNNLQQNKQPLIAEEWSKPEIKIIPVTEITLGNSSTGGDASQSRSGPPL
jgi:hypothetical protein